MRRFEPSHLATIPTALAVAMAALTLVTALTHLFVQLHGWLDSAAVVSVIYAMRRHEARSKGGDRHLADAGDYTADYQRTLRTLSALGRITAKNLREDEDDDGDGRRKGRCA